MRYDGVLMSLAAVNERLIELEFHLRSRPSVSDTRHGFDLRKCGTGCRIDIYAEAYLGENVSYCWWLEISIQNDVWSLRSCVLRDSAKGQEIVEEFPERRGSTAEGLVQATQGAGDDLVTSCKGFVLPSVDE